MYDCISWINRNYKKSGCNTFEKLFRFWSSFYITTFENQAKKWAVRKGMRQEKVAIVNVYELSEEWDNFKVLSFGKENEKWLDFVCACRKGQPLNKEYDIIKGNVADVSTVIRVALTSSSMTPDLYELLRLMGKDRIKERFSKLN